MKHAAVVFALVSLGLLSACGELPPPPPPPPPPPGPSELRFTEIAVEPDLFVDLAFVPGRSDELLIATLDGTVGHYRLDADEAVRIGGFQVPDVIQEMDCGVQGLSFDPAWPENGFLFVSHCGPEFVSRVTRLTWDGETGDSVEASAVVIIDVSEPSPVRPTRHSTGSLRFDETDALFVPIGDKSVTANGGERSRRTASILRIAPSREAGAGGFTIPADNPFVDDPDAAPEIWVYGTRFPWRLAQDRTGRLWFGDVGENLVEEVNLVTQPGADFGWGEGESRCEGPCDPPNPEIQDPLLSWDRSESHPYILDDLEAELTALRLGWSGDGRPADAPDAYDGLLDHDIVFGDACLGWIRGASADESGAVTQDEFIAHLPFVTGWRFSDAGLAYAVTFAGCNLGDDIQPPRLFRLDLVPQED